jgi:hypothetical protein
LLLEQIAVPEDLDDPNAMIDLWVVGADVHPMGRECGGGDSSQGVGQCSYGSRYGSGYRGAYGVAALRAARVPGVSRGQAHRAGRLSGYADYGHTLRR